MKHVQETTGGTALSAARKIMEEYDQMVAEGKLDSVTPIQSITPTRDGNKTILSGYSRQAKVDGHHMYYMNVANEVTDTLYLFVFEGDSATWEKDFAGLGKDMTTTFVLLPGV